MQDQTQQPKESRGYDVAQKSLKDQDEIRSQRHREKRSRWDSHGSQRDRKSSRTRQQHRRRKHHREDDTSSSSDSSSHHRRRKRRRKIEEESSENDNSDENRRIDSSKSRKQRRRDIGSSPSGQRGNIYVNDQQSRWTDRQQQEETAANRSTLEGSSNGDPSKQVRSGASVPMFLARRGERPRLNSALKRNRGGVIVAQAMKAKGPDGTIGFASRWTSRKSRFTET